MKKNKIKIKFTPFTLTCLIVLCLITIGYIYLIIWGVINSFKDGLEFYNNIVGLPKKFQFSNYVTILQHFFYKNPVTQQIVTIDMMLFNSILYSLGCTFASVLVCSITAYATSMFKYKFSKVIYAMVLFVITVPIIGSAASEMLMVRKLNLYDTFIGNFILKANFASIYYMVFHAMFKSIPKDYEEAAKIDGAGNLMIMLKIYYPLIMNAILTVSLIYFIGYWNDFQTPYLYLPTSPTVSLGLFYFYNSTNIEISWTPLKLGACIIVFIPIFIVFLLTHKRLIGNVSIGGIKG